MPLFIKEEITEGVSFAIWKIEEELDVLLNLYLPNESELELINEFKFEKKRTEFLSARLALKTLLPEQNYLIEKDKFGKPHVDLPEIHISLSHANGFGAAAISNIGPIGIDIEHERPQILRIARKFLHDSEKPWATEKMKELTQIWCAKEALYKLHGRTQLIFAEQLFVGQPNPQMESQGQIIENHATSSFALKWTHFNDLMVCLAY